MKNPVILVVEDDTVLNDAYKTILESANHTVFTAYDGQEALEVTKQHTPDIIFRDRRMPGMDGIGFLKAYKPKETNPNAHVIVFSNYDMQAEVDEAYQLGADRYVLKALAAPNDLLKIVADLS